MTGSVQGVNVSAVNDADFTALMNSDLRSNGEAIGLVLSFNSAGYGGSNLLFSLIDTLIPEDPTGDHESLSATRDGKTSRGMNVEAYITIISDVQGDITIDADSTNDVEANIKSVVVSVDIAASGDETLNLSISPILSLNRLKYNTDAYATGNTLLSASDELSITANDTSLIDAFVLAPAITAGANFSSSDKSISVGIAVSRSAIRGNVNAYLDGEGVVTDVRASAVSVLATRSVTIDTTAAAVAVSISAAGSGSAVAASGGGALALNELKGAAASYIDEALISSDGATGQISGDIRVETVDISNIDAEIVAAAASVGLSASDKATAVALGFSLAYNVIGWGMNPSNPGSPDDITAYVGDVDLFTAGDLIVSAANTDGTNNRTIDALVASIAVGIAASAGGQSIGASVSASIALNRIAGNVKAYIGGTTAVTNTLTAANIDVIAKDRTDIFADTVAASITASLSGGADAVGVSIALSYAENLIENKVEAYIQNADVTASGDITVDADQISNIRARGIAAAISVTASAGGNSIAISGGGIVVRNVITGDTYAYLENSDISGATDITITADNDATINATVAAVSGSLAFGGSTGVAVAIGAGAAVNYIGVDQLGRGMGDVHAYINNSDISATGDLAVRADSTMNIDAIVIAAAVGLSATGSDSIALGGAGAGTGNTIAASVQAYIQTDDIADGVNAGSITVTAQNNSAIDVITGAASVQAAFGGGNTVSFSIAIAAAINQIHTRTAAYISGFGSDNNAANVGVRATTGDVLVDAVSNASINADTIAASLGVAIGGGSAGVSISGAGAGAGNDIMGYTHAYIDGSDVRAAGDVTVDVDQTNRVFADVAAVAASAAVSGTAGVGVALGGGFAFNRIRGEAIGTTDKRYDVNFVAQADLESGDLVKASDGNWYRYSGASGTVYFNDKDSDEDTNPVTDFGDTSLWSKVSNGDFDVRSYITNGSIWGDDLNVTADTQNTMNTNTAAGAAAITGGGTVGVGVAGSFAFTQNQNRVNTRAYVDGSGAHTDTATDTINVDDINIKANDVSSMTTLTAAASLAASFSGTASVSVSFGGAISRNVMNNMVEAYLADFDEVNVATNGAVEVIATEDATANTEAWAASAAVAVSGTFSLSLSGAGAEANNVVDNVVNARIENASITTDKNGSGTGVAGDVIVKAINDVDVYARGGAISAAINGGIAGGSGAIGATVSRNTIGKGFNLDAIDRDLLDAVDQDATYGDNSGAIDTQEEIDRVNELASNGNHNNTADAIIKNSTITSDSDVIVEGRVTESATTLGYAGSLAVGISIGGAIAAAGAESTTVFSSSSSAFIEDSTVNAQGDVRVRAFHDSLLDGADAIGASLAGGFVGGSVGVAIIQAKFLGKSEAAITGDSSDTITAGDDVVVKADVVRAEVRGQEAVMASVAIGGVAVAGGGLGIENLIQNDVDARITGQIVIDATDEVNVLAEEDADLQATAVAATIAVGASFAQAVGVSVVRNRALSSIVANVTNASVTAEDMTVKAVTDTNITETTSAAVSASTSLAGQLNIASAIIDTEVKAAVSGGTYTLEDELTIFADANNYLRVHGAGGAFGAGAIGGLLVQGTIGRADVLDPDSDSPTVVNTEQDVVAEVGNNTTINANTLDMDARTIDDVYADGTAAGGGGISITGVVTTIQTDQIATVNIGDSANITTTNVQVTSEQIQDSDSSADAYSIALATGAGAFNLQENNSQARIIMGASSIKAKNIVFTANNELDRDRHGTNGYNLRTGSAGVGNVQILQSLNDLNNASAITVGDGATLTATGTYADAGSIKFNVSTDINAKDRVLLEAVSGFGVGTAKSEVDVDASNTVNIGAANINAGIGTFAINTQHEGLVVTDANMTMLSAFSGISAAESYALQNMSNTININNADIKGRYVELYAGRNDSAQLNDLYSNAEANIFAASLYPNIGVPLTETDVIENNTINITGSSDIGAMQDVTIHARDGLAAGDRRLNDGAILSVSAIPYGIPAVKQGEDTSNNTVNVASTANIKAGVYDDLQYQVYAVGDSATLGAVVANNISLPSDITVGANGEISGVLTDAQKTTYGITSDVDYEFANLNIDNITLDLLQGQAVVTVSTGHTAGGEVGASYLLINPNAGVANGAVLRATPHLIDYSDTSIWRKLNPSVSADQDMIDGTNEDIVNYNSNITQTLLDALEGKFYVVKPVHLEAPTLRYVNIANNLITQREQLETMKTSHSTNPQAIARYQAQIDEIDRSLVSYGLVSTETDGDGNEFQVIRRDIDVLVVELPDMHSGVGTVIIRSDGQVLNAQQQTNLTTAASASEASDITITSAVPFTLEVADAIMLSDSRSDTIGESFVDYDKGSVYFNTTEVENGTGGTSEIDVSVNYDSGATWGTYLGLTGVGAVTSLNITGSVYNQQGNLSASNDDGGINVTGETRAASVNIDSAAGLSINSDSVYHVNRDPRQYINYTTYANLAKSYGGNFSTSTFLTGTFAQLALNLAINQDTSLVEAAGDININARVVNVNGTIRSGVQNYELEIGSQFSGWANTYQAAGTNVTLDNNSTTGIDFDPNDNGTQKFSARYDAHLDAIVISELTPQAGRVYITGTVISTGNGTIEVASGYASLDIDNNSDLDIILDGVDLSTNREGLIQITDISRLTVGTTGTPTPSFGSGVRTTYTYTGSQINVASEGGRVKLLTDGTYELEYSSATNTTVNSDSTTWTPRDDSLYVWVEGQEQTQVSRYKYEKNSFNWSGIDILNDVVLGDGSEAWSTTENRDASPLLESEAVVAPGDSNYVSYGQNKGYSVQWENTIDLSVDIENGDRVRIKNLTTEERNLYFSFTGEYPSNPPSGSVGQIYEYQGSSPIDVLLTDVDYANDSDWVLVTESGFSPNFTTKFDSSFFNREYSVEQWTTGGGYMKKKTFHTLVTESLGTKQYWTHTLAADKAIDIEFNHSANQSVNIDTSGDVIIRGDVRLGASSATASITTSSGDIRNESGSGILGASVTLSASGGAVDLVLTGGTAAMDVTARNDIDLQIVGETNSEQSLVVGAINSTHGDVTLDVANSITAENGASLITGNTVSLVANAGQIGTNSQAIRVNTDATNGGLTATSTGNMNLQEISGNLRLTDPGFGSTASLRSTTGSVTVDVASGSLIDAWSEGVAPISEAEALAQAQELGFDSGAANIAAINEQIDDEEAALTRNYHNYWADYRNLTLSGDNGLVTVNSTDLVTTGVDLNTADFTATGYAEFDALLSTDAGNVDLTAGQLVRDTNGNYFTVDADINYALADANLTGVSGFTAVNADFDAAAGLNLTLDNGDIIEVADTALSSGDVILTSAGELLSYSGSNARFYLPLVSSSTTDFTTIAESTVVTGISNATQTNAITAGTVVQNTITGEYFVAQNNLAANWTIPTEDGDDWAEVFVAETLPTIKTYYTFTGTDGTTVDLAANPMFEAVTGLSTFTFEHDFVNGSYPNVETDDIVDDAGTKYVYDGADTISDFDLSSINYSTSSNWTAVNEVTTSTTGRDLAVDLYESSTDVDADDIIKTYASDGTVTYYYATTAETGANLYDSSTYTSDYIDLGADLSSADQTLSSGAQSPNAALTQYQIIEDADNSGTMYLYIGATDSAVSNIDFTDTDDFLAITSLAEIDTAIDVTDGDYLRAVDGTIYEVDSDGTDVNPNDYSTFTNVASSTASATNLRIVMAGEFVKETGAGGTFFRNTGTTALAVDIDSDLSGQTDLTDTTRTSLDADVAISDFDGTSVDVATNEYVRTDDGSVYKFINATNLTGADLTTTAFSDTDNWELVEEDYDLAEEASGLTAITSGQTVDALNGDRYRFVGSSTSLDLSTVDFSSSQWQLIAADVNAADVGTVTVNNLDYVIHATSNDLYQYVGTSAQIDVLSLFAGANPALGDDWQRVHTYDSVDVDLQLTNAPDAQALTTNDVVITMSGDAYQYTVVLRRSRLRMLILRIRQPGQKLKCSVVLQRQVRLSRLP